MTGPAQLKTLDPANQLVIVCPIFRAKTKIASCFELRDLVWRGEEVPVRRGCQIAMHASKCPINHILNDIRLRKNDPYHSDQPKVGELKPDLLKRIAPILVSDWYLKDSRLPPAERALLMKANERAHDAGNERYNERKTRRARAAEAIENIETSPNDGSAITQAAETGDMAAAINEEMKANVSE